MHIPSTVMLRKSMAPSGEKDTPSTDRLQKNMAPLGEEDIP
jgi:hypothetical protein